MMVIKMRNLMQQLVQKFESNYRHYKNVSYNESETRNEFIDPFFSALGWDVQNSRGINPWFREVMVENYLTRSSRPDYAFTLSGVKKFFVEAKKPSVNILENMDSIFQARRYGWSAGHKIVVLTNFEYLLIYDCSVPPHERDVPNTALLKKYAFNEYVEKYDEIGDIISREIVYSGRFESNFESEFSSGGRLSIDEYFLEQINRWRIDLGNYLHSKNPEFTLEYINDRTQEFLNQIIFLRICEDRNLPLYHNLKNTLEDINELKNSLDRMFKEADLKYNSGIFSSEFLIFDLSNEIIMDIIENLYYPKSPYVFNVIESNLLGQIYELFLCEKISLLDNQIILKNRSNIENRDIVITPEEIVKYMVRETMGPILEGLSPSDIKLLKFADISCGSGVFLLEMYDFLIQHCIKWYLLNDQSKLIPCDFGQFNLCISEKKEILTSCIYGLDIDANAVEISKFSLLIKLLENETVPSLNYENSILSNLDNNIKSGNALVDYSDISDLDISDETIKIIHPFNWTFGGSELMFDSIIGNPPYVATDDIIRLHPAEEVRVFKRYTTAYKQYDKYFLFVERGLQKLKENGQLSYIIPNKFATAGAGTKLRALITSNKFVSEFIDFGSAHLFKDKMAYSSILKLTKSTQPNFKYSVVENVQEWWSNLAEGSSRDLSVTINSDSIGSDTWLLTMNLWEDELFSKLYSNSVLLKQVAKPINGIQTSAEQPNPIYWFSTNEIVSEDQLTFTINKFEQDFTIEKSILKPYFKPTVLRTERNVSTYDLVDTNKWIIFPYNENGELYNQSEMQQYFSGTWEYLKFNYEKLVPRQVSGKRTGRDLPHATAETWYHYGRIQHLNSFANTEKIIVRVLRNLSTPFYYYDENDWIIAAGGTAGYCAIIAIQNGYELEYIQAILNHPAIGYLISKQSSQFGGNYFANGTSVLNKVPVKKIDITNTREVSLYNQIVNNSKLIYEINGKLKSDVLSTREKAVYIERKNMLIKSVRDSVTELYGIEHLITNLE